jgi:DNA-binding response OmpR family regulator
VARLVLPTAAGTPAAAGEVEPGRGTARVLIVEDDARVRETLVDLVSREGYVPLPAGDAREGLELLEREAVNVVLTAHAFADGSGLELARSVKRRRPDTPVILLTAWPGRLDPAVILASGIDRVIEKPVGAAAVLAALDAALGRRGSVGA